MICIPGWTLDIKTAGIVNNFSQSQKRMTSETEKLVKTLGSASKQFNVSAEKMIHDLAAMIETVKELKEQVKKTKPHITP